MIVAAECLEDQCDFTNSLVPKEYLQRRVDLVDRERKTSHAQEDSHAGTVKTFTRCSILAEKSGGSKCHSMARKNCTLNNPNKLIRLCKVSSQDPAVGPATRFLIGTHLNSDHIVDNTTMNTYSTIWGPFATSTDNMDRTVQT